jgi:hypothetical protein
MHYIAPKVGLTLVLTLVLYCSLVGKAFAHHLCISDNASDLRTKSTLGPGREIKDEWVRSPLLGCQLTVEADLPAGTGRFADFERGQIVYSPAQRMVVAAYVDDAARLVAHWVVTTIFTYDFFLIRAQRVDGPDFGDPRKNTSQQTVSASHGTEGKFPYGAGAGTYSISVEGCDDDNLLGLIKTGSSSCKQSWSLPTVVDVAFVDVAHKADGVTELPSASSPAQTAATFDDRARIGYQNGCTLPLGGNPNEEFAFAALARLAMATRPGLGSCASNPADRIKAIQDVNAALSNAKVDANVGTDLSLLGADPGASVGGAVGCAVGASQGSVFGPFGAIVGCIGGALAGGAAGAAICGDTLGSGKGDYDMALRGLIPLMYEFGSILDDNVRLHVLNSLLNQTGGSDKVRTKYHICRATVDETENHVLATESSRYLTNQLRMAEMAKSHLPGTPEFEAARQTFDNTVNGLDGWMLNHLQKFLKGDFHEYNSRPYQRLSVMSIRNLADYASSAGVREEARMVLDYLAAKFAAGSVGLRRSAPFRRHNDHLGFTLLYSNYSDEETWRFMVMAGNTEAIRLLHHGHADWASAETMAYAGLGTYRVPDLILRTMIDKSSPYFQVIHHEGVELYSSDRSFLISAGGDYEPSRPVDEVLGLSKPDTDGTAQPTVLIPSFSGIDLNDMITINGAVGKKRTNTCVAPGFACGLNIVVPLHYQSNSSCFRVSGRWIFVDATPGCEGVPIRSRGFYVAVFRAACNNDCNGLGVTFGLFEVVDFDGESDFNTFVNTTIGNNGADPQFTSNGVNTYTTFDGRRISFTPNHAAGQWGITGGAGVNIPTDEEAWRLAKGDIIDADGSGCVVIKDAPSGRALVLDARTPPGSSVPVPKRTERTLIKDLTCDTPLSAAVIRRATAVPTAAVTPAKGAGYSALQGEWRIDEANLQDGMMVWSGDAVLSSGGTIVLDAHKNSIAGRSATQCERQTKLHAAFALGVAQQTVPFREMNCEGTTLSGEVRVASFSRDDRSFYGSFWQGGVKLGDFTASKQ